MRSASRVAMVVFIFGQITRDKPYYKVTLLFAMQVLLAYLQDSL
jgi:hypothetical protein